MDFVLNRFSDPHSYAYSYSYRFDCDRIILPQQIYLERIKRHEVLFFKGPCPAKYQSDGGNM